jgi:hypothetical protein
VTRGRATAPPRARDPVRRCRRAGSIEQRPTTPVAFAVTCVFGALCACKGPRDAPSQDPPAAPVPARDAAAPDADLDACRAAAARLPGLPPAQRAAALIDGCRPCGDWQPLLTWNTLETDGGPSRAAIERALVACRAFCEPGARQRFLGTLDAARGQDTRGPWRYLGEICKAAVSAVPDSRFMGAPYFALDRIARALGGPGGDPALVAAIELPLPALGINGVGVDLPRAAGPPTGAEAGPPALTVYVDEIQLGALPRATLSATGVAVSGDYPGTSIAPAKLAAALARGPAAVLAPRLLPAARIAEVVAAAGGGHDLRLAVAVPGPGGWAIPTALPVALGSRSAAHGVRLALGSDAAAAIAQARAAPAADLTRDPPVIAIDRAATVDGLAGLLGALAVRGVTSVALTASPAPPRPRKP